MIVAFTGLPDSTGSPPRPLLDVWLADMDEVRVPALVDSGSLHTLLPRWLADSAGLDLSGADHRSLAVAAGSTDAAFVTTALSVADASWEAEVGFCDPWIYSWGILGQSSFLRYFVVTFRAADFEFEVEALAT